MTFGWYNRDGEPISMEEAHWLLADQEARRVGLDQIGPYMVSTVFLVLDHGLGQGKPVLYETMVFSADAWHEPAGGKARDLKDFDILRYHTEAEARQGHEAMLTLIRATTQDLPENTEAPDPG